MRFLLGSAVNTEAEEINLVIEDAFYDRLAPVLEQVYANLPEQGPGRDAMREVEALWYERENAKVEAALARRQAVSPHE